MSDAVVISGVGAVTPLGAGAQRLFDGWLAGESGIEDGLGRCADFDPVAALGVKTARRADRCTQFALVAAEEALAQAGLGADAGGYDPNRVGVILGTGIGGIDTLVRAQHVLDTGGPQRVPPLSVPLMMANAPSGSIALRHGLGGPSYSTVSACAAGAHAIGAGLRAIQAGDADAMIVGGAEAALVELSRAGFAVMDATSRLGVSRPFDARRDGFVMGEGAGVLVLERETAARGRGARVIARLSGFGATSDAHHITAPHPQGDGARRAILRALQDAGVPPEAVDYVNAHGTSTPLNDRAETLALKSSLGDRAQEIPVSSLKSSIGHLLGAAGAVEAIVTALALQAGVAPPTLNYEEPESGLDLDYVADGPRALKRNGRPLAAISNSFGFGGHNAVLCLQEAR